MGNIVPEIKAPNVPKRPFHRGKGKLVRLILNRQWQRVLVRLPLYPRELQQRVHIKEINSKVLPIHLMCAMDAPDPVIALALSHYLQSASIPMIRWQSSKRATPWCCKGQIPGSVEGDSQLSSPEALLDRKTLYYSAHDDNASHSSSISSKSFLLQLPPATPVLNTSHETQDTTVFGVTWDLDPLLEVEHLLPLHIACLCQARNETIRLLLEAYPLAALVSVQGMLPIHWVAAGWRVTSPFHLSSPVHENENEYSVTTTLTLLMKAVPDSIRVRSGNHGMTVKDYVEECMDDGFIKYECLKIFDPGYEPSILESIIFQDDDDDTIICEDYIGYLPNLVEERNWDAIEQVIEIDPGMASKWLYGLDETTSASPIVWKRLPLHVLCYTGAPADLFENLIRVYPEAVLQPEPQTEDTPLHIACKMNAMYSTVRLLLDTRLEVCRATNRFGQTPLHVAVESKACYSIIEMILTEDPEVVALPDTCGKTPADYSLQLYGADDVVSKLLIMYLMRLSVVR